MVAHCCRFLCYFCRISRHNQRAMFDHLSYLLDNSNVGLGMFILILIWLNLNLNISKEVGKSKCDFFFFISFSLNERINSSGCGGCFSHGQQRTGTCSYRGRSGESKSHWLILSSLFYIASDFWWYWTVCTGFSFVQVVQYLGGCGLRSCALLVSKGYPDIGWNPVEGERYLDFLRFAVFCNGNEPFLNPDLVKPN